mgnify:CR=1 FL=1|jgi:hypothetical protein
MNLAGDWSYLQKVAANRLASNKTPRHVYRYGEEIELLGAAGELAARRFLGLPEDLHENFDHGVDLVWHGINIDVKATHMTPKVAYRYLQWPREKRVKADVVLLTAVDLQARQATVLGYAYKEDVLNAPVNETRDYPCHEIPVTKLRPAWELQVMRKSSNWTRTSVLSEV